LRMISPCNTVHQAFDDENTLFLIIAMG